MSAFFRSLAVCAATLFFNFLLISFSSGVRCVSLCLFLTGCPPSSRITGAIFVVDSTGVVTVSVDAGVIFLAGVIRIVVEAIAASKLKDLTPLGFFLTKLRDNFAVFGCRIALILWLHTP